MGIPSYFNFILKKHSNIIKKKSFIRSDYLFIDANSIIYDTIYDNKINCSDKNDDIYIKIYDNITKLIKTVSPNKKTYICFDGIPPYAKIVQQRQRRYKGSLTNKLLNKKKDWNTNQITPGTDFMKNLDLFLINKYKNNKNINFSGSMECMEGEHKISKIIRSNITNEEDNIIIYGLDADLFILGLLLVNENNRVFLYKETKHFSYIKNINEGMEYYFDLNIFSEQISSSLNNSCKYSATYDYCFLTFLCGNDFMPHTPSINIRNNGIELIINKYVEYIEKHNDSIINKNTKSINWNNLRKYLLMFVKDENENILNNIKWKINLNITANCYEEKLNFLPCVDIENELFLYNNINDYNKIILNSDSAVCECNNYLEVLEWTWYYYNGDNLNNTIYYKYENGPLLKDIIKYIPVTNGENILKKKETPEINVNTLLYYVLPYEEHNDIIPKNVTNKVSNIIYNEYPEFKNIKYTINYFLCKYFWESHLKFNHLDIYKLNNIICKNI